MGTITEPQTDELPDFLESLTNLSGDGLHSLNNIMQTAPYGVYVDHPVNGCVYANKYLTDAFGLEWSDFRGFGWARSVHADDVPRMQAAIEAYEHSKDSIFITYRFVRPDGEIRWLNARVHAILDDQQNHIGSIGICTDITDERNFLDRSGESQKLEAVGRLSARVAHDFNNVLAAMLISASMIEPAGEHAKKQSEHLNVIFDAIEQAKLMTQQMLAISRGRNESGNLINLDSEISKITRLLKSTLGEGIELRSELHASDITVAMDRGQLGQILLNLCTNGRDAVDGRGLITIRTFRDGKFIRMEVSDAGKGMDTETLHRASEPFFTTKPSGLGTGLGLSTVTDTVKLMGGSIDIESTPVKGTTVKIHLPVINDQYSQPDPDQDMNPAEFLTNLELLIIEDNDALRQASGYAFALHGSVVHVAANLAEAAEILNEKNIQAIVSDFLLPDGNATDLITSAIDLPIVFVSGYMEDKELPIKTKESAWKTFLLKPYRCEKLVNLLAKNVAAFRRQRSS